MAAFENRALLSLSPLLHCRRALDTKRSLNRVSTRRTCASAPVEARATATSGKRASSAGELQRRLRRRREGGGERRAAAVDAAIGRGKGRAFFLF